MKISENWLRTWVNPAIDSETLSNQLTMLGLEVDDMSPAAKPFTGVVVGEVLTVEQHPDQAIVFKFFGERLGGLEKLVAVVEPSGLDQSTH